MNLWANISTAGVDVRNIRIPKVSKKQMETAIYWTVRKEAPFDEKESIFDFEVQGEVVDQGVPKLSVMVYTAPQSEVEELRRLFVRSGFPLSGISITPFAVQNLLRTKLFTPHKGSMATLFIGNDFSRIDIYAESNLVMTRGIKAGTKSMLESLQEKISEKVQVYAGEVENTLPVTLDHARKLLYSLSPDSPHDEELSGEYRLTRPEIFNMALPALSRLIQQVERTFKYYEFNSGYEKVNKLYISSTINMYRPLIDYVGDQLGIERDVLDPLGQNNFLSLQDGKIDTVSESIAFTPALGLALSDISHTPNFIVTFRDKEKQASLIRINKLIIFGFIASFLICTTIFVYQGHLLKVRKAERTRVESELTSFNPRLDQTAVLQMALALKNQHPDSERYLVIALISELSELTPSHVQILGIKANVSEELKTKVADAKNAVSAGGKQETAKTVHLLEIEGMINGERKILESLLAQYVMKLGASSLFSDISIQKNAVEPLGKGEMLHFTLNAKIT